VSFVGYSYDYYLPYLLDDHAALVKAGADVQLMVVPGPHTDFQGLASGMHQAFDWLDAHLLGDRTRLDPSPVRVTMAGGGGLRRLPAWPPEFAARRLYLSSGGRLVETPALDSEPDRYRYDPADPTPAVGGTTISSNSGPRDNRNLEARRDVLTYTGEPLTEALEIMGPVAAEIYASSSLGHTDFFARLCDVAPDGRSTNVCDGLLRLRPNDPPRDAAGVTCLRVELWPAAHRFDTGHRLRLQVSSGSHPRYARNLGSGEPLATATTLVAADQAVFHDPAHPSAIVLPVIATGSGSVDSSTDGVPSSVAPTQPSP
jgi:putative CocE/NonD family hydrolase